MAQYMEAALPGRLAPFVESLVGYRITGARPGTHIGMPSDTLTLVVSLDDPLDLVGADGREGRYDAMVAGLHAGPALIRHDGSQHGVQLDLTPAGAALLLGGPAGELAGTSVDLDLLIGPSARQLHERLSESEGWESRFALVVEALLAHREATWQPRPEVGHAWRLLRRSRGRAPIHAIAAEVGWSTRHLGTQFRHEFGQSPKTTARVMRFQESRRLIGQGRPLAEVAAACGFVDQSHLNRDWLDFAGTSPTRWLHEDEIAFVQDTSGAVAPS
jgi:AraC-like DNA-binding protein